MKIGPYIRKTREELQAAGGPFSLRDVAKRIGKSPTYLSLVETGKEKPSEEALMALAGDLGEDVDVLLALSGRVSKDLQAIICQNPKAFAALIRELRDRPEQAIQHVTTAVRDGEW